jgi:hypothetical protein
VTEKLPLKLFLFSFFMDFRWFGFKNKIENWDINRKRFNGKEITRNPRN